MTPLVKAARSRNSVESIPTARAASGDPGAHPEGSEGDFPVTGLDARVYPHAWAHGSCDAPRQPIAVDCHALMMYDPVFREADSGMLSAKHVVLGLLIQQRGYGYEIQQRLDRRFGFLRLSRNVIYGLLDSLEKEGWARIVGEKPSASPRGAPRKVYAPTPGGEEEFVRWLGEPCEIGVTREEFHVKLVLSGPLHWPRVIAMAEALEQSCLSAIYELQMSGQPSLEALMEQEPADELVAAVMVDDAEVLRLQAMIDWLQRVRLYGERRMDPPPRRLGNGR